MKLRKIFAAVMACSIVCGTQTMPIAYRPIIGITANADVSSVSFDKATGTLTLSGNVVNEEVQTSIKNEKVSHIVCAKGTILPSDCSYMFASPGYESYYSENLVSIDLSNADTSNVTNMNGMFSECSCLTELDVSNFDTSKVTDMGMMFEGCSALTSLDVSNFDTSKVTNMSHMFSHCSSLTEIDVSGFDTNNVTDMNSMFWLCSSLIILDLRNFDTSNVTDMSYMFDSCYELTTLDLSNFDTNNVVSTSVMFLLSHKLGSIIVSDKWNMDNLSYSRLMFYGCKSLVGGNGTVYNDDHVDGEYARIDSDNAPGYFTADNNSAITTTSSSTTATTTTTTEPTTTTTTESTTTETTTAATTNESATTTASVQPEVTFGDPTGDGKIDAKDATFVLVEYAKLSTGGESELSDAEKSAADVHKDGKADAKDASAILSYYAYVSTGGTDTIQKFLKTE